MPPPASLPPAARRFRGVAAALASSSPVPPAADHRRRLRLSGKVAAVTGGASGIGEAAVRLFVEEGAAVAFCDRDGKRGDAIASELRNAGARVLFVQVSSTGIEAECARFVAETVAEFGSLSILVNNAAVRSYLKVTEATEDSWDEIWSVNVKGYAFCSKAAIPTMASTGGGSIVNVASHRALVAGPKTVQYDTTKAAVAGLTRSMARDHAEDGVRVNSVAPGPTMTRFHELRLQVRVSVFPCLPFASLISINKSTRRFVHHDAE